jgi:ubiquinone/menaquinone biosynthesis C-methylase UbiE
MDEINSSYKNEISVQDGVSEEYESVRYAKDYSVRYQNAWFRDMVSLVNRPGLVLDNGCGVGYLAEFMPSNSIVGLDASTGMLSKAKSRLDRVVYGDSQSLPFKDEMFDVVFCRSLLHHLPEPDKGIDEMFRVLKEGGEIIVAEPIKSILSELPRKMVKGSEHFSDLHKDFIDTELLVSLRRRFNISDVKYFGYIAYPVLGFPDVVDPLKRMPFKKVISSVLINLDRFISKVPVIRKQSWGIMIRALK